MRIPLLFLLLFVFCSLNYSQAYKKVKIYINSKEDIQKLYSAGLDFDHLYFDDKDNSIQVFLNDMEFLRLTQTNYNYKILIDDWQKYYDARPKISESAKHDMLAKTKTTYGVTGFGFGSMGGYYTLAEVNAKLDTMKLLFPNLITTKISIGNTIEGRPIYSVKISDNPDVDEDEPEVLYTALHHAREPESMMQMIYFMYYLLENYYSDPSVKYLVDNRELFFIPVVNPDGYEYNRRGNPNGGGMWRKNNSLSADGFVGVDLNRNYGPQNYWNAPNAGSSTRTSDDTYRGTAPFSELETQAIRNFLNAHKIKAALNYHSFGNWLIFPYGALGHESADSSIFREYAKDMTIYNKFRAGTDFQTVGYSTRGNSDDYFYDGDTISTNGKIIAMTPEVGGPQNDVIDSFWPPQDKIIPLAEVNLYPNLYYAMVAGEYVRFSAMNLSKNYFQPGESVSFNPVFKNKGLKDASNIRIDLSSLSPYVTIKNSSAEFAEIKSRNSSLTQTPFSLDVSSSAPLEQNVKLLFKTHFNGIEISRDTVSIAIKGPVLPVELQSFNASANKDGVLLQWVTSSETNNHGFEIQKTAIEMDTPGEFNSIAFIKGKGSTSGVSNYSFFDSNPLMGKSIYRLKQVDFDGTFNYSSGVEINFASNYSLGQNYPNPFNPSTKINYVISEPGLTTLRIFDILGNEVALLVNELMQTGKYEIEFNAAGLTSGVYYYKLTSGSYTSTKKLLLMK